MKSENILYLDAETQTKNKGHPFTPSNRLISYVTKTATGSSNFQYFTDPDFCNTLSNKFEYATEFVGFNIKFDFHWGDTLGVTPGINQKVWDCQLAEFVISGQTNRMASLDDTLVSYGFQPKVDKVKEYWNAGIDTDQIPVPILEEYNKYDVDCLPLLRETQQSIMSPKQIALVYLMGEDLKTLQHAEFNGIKWDHEKALEKLDSLDRKLDTIQSRLNSYLGDLPEHFSFNWDSGDHLSLFLYGGVLKYDYSIPETSIYKSGPSKGQAYVKNRWFVSEVSMARRFNPIEGTELKKSKTDANASIRFYQTDQPTLLSLKTNKKENKELLALLQERSQALKVSEMIRSIIKKKDEMEWSDNYLHPQFNQNIAITGRLTSSNPNGQNTPDEINELLISRYND